jgi:hypothetical protein
MSTWRDGNRKKKKYIWQKKNSFNTIQFTLWYIFDRWFKKIDLDVWCRLSKF